MRLSCLLIVFGWTLVFGPRAVPAPGGPPGRDVKGLVDADAASMTFRFRTKFNRQYAAANEGKRVLVAYKTSTPPILDGFLEDECWKHAGRTQSAWVQMITRDPSPKQTVLYACYDDRNLYFAYVAEEPHLKSVFFYERRDAPGSNRFEAYRGDCGELFLETDGLGGDGHGWQFIFNIYPHMTYDGTNPNTPEGVNWESGYRVKGALGPKRWVVELAIPFKGFKYKGYEYQGPPKRGEKWGVRIVRDGRPPPSGEDRMFSTWTYNPVKWWHNPWPAGTLIFDTENCLRNGEFSEVNDDGSLKHWRLGKSRDGIEGALLFDAKETMGALTCKLEGEEDIVQISQHFGVKPNKFYHLAGKIKIAEGQGKVTVGFVRPASKSEITTTGKWVDVDLEMYASGVQQDAACYLMVQGGVRKVLLDRLKVVQEPFGIEKGMYCLTGNSFRPELNVRDAWGIKGRYTYREPETTLFKPPYRKVWTELVWNGYDDKGTKLAKDGWYGFDKGSLTMGGRNLVQWPWPALTHLLSPTYPKGHEILFDLGEDHYFMGVDMLVAMSVKQVLVSVKPSKADDFVLVDKLNGAGVLDPPGPKLYYRGRGLNSVARWVRLQVIEDGNEGVGIFFTQLWGKKKGDHGDFDVTRFRWKKGLVVEKPKVPPIGKLKGPFILPQPRQLAWTGRPFVMTPATKIAHSDKGYMGGVAEDFVEHVRETCGMSLKRVPLADELKTNPTLAGCIAVGDVQNSPAMRAIVAREKLKVTRDDPGQQGYVLIVGPQRVLIAGSGEDHVGAFYGLTSLKQILSWDDAGRLTAAGCRVRDWPNGQLRDMIAGFTDYLRLDDEFRRTMKAFAFIKINGLYGGRYGCDPYDDAARRKWEAIRRFADTRGFLIMGSFGGGSGSTGWPIGTEKHDDEDKKYLMEKTDISRLNVCPSSSWGYRQLLKQVDRGMYDSMHDAEAAMLDLDEMGHISSGSRWNADRRTRRRNLTGDRLLYEYICRYYDGLRRRGVKMDTIDCMLTKDAQGDRFHNMSGCYPYIPRDMIMSSWKGSIGKPDTNPEYAIDNFERVYTWNNWGYRTNWGEQSLDFNQTTDRKLWGTRSCPWGGRSNEGLTLGLLAKIAGGGCMCGNLLLQTETEYVWSPRNPMPNTMEFVRRIYHTTVRLNEIVNNRPFPSWQDNRRKRWFKVDLRGVANWSHIDEIPADGKGWLDWGSNYDMRLMPMGDVQFEEVPFRVLDPKTNDERSIIFIANYPGDAKLAPALPTRVPEIPIGRKVASLCFLKARVGEGTPPSFVAVYEGGRNLTFNIDVRNIEVAKSYIWSRPHEYENVNAYGRSMGDANPLLRHLSWLSRPAWLGYATSGDECSVRIHEWVNPYPELRLDSIRIFFPPAQYSGEREAVFAVSGIETEPQDVARWTDGRKRPYLRPAIQAVPLDGLRPLIAGGKVAREERKSRKKMGKVALPDYVDGKGEWMFRARGVTEAGRVFSDDTSPCWFPSLYRLSARRRLEIAIRTPAAVSAIRIRGRFIAYKEDGNQAAGEYLMPYLDCKVSVHKPQGGWVEVGELKSICGEDGDHWLRGSGDVVDCVRIDVDVLPYHENYYGRYNVPGLSYVQLYGPK